MKFQLRILMVLIFTFVCMHCSTHQGKVKQVQNGVQVALKNQNVKVQFFAENIVRIIKWMPQSTPEKKSLVVTKAMPDQLTIERQEDNNFVKLTSGIFQVVISKRDGSIRYLKPDHTAILSESGKALFSPVVYLEDSAYTIQQNFKLSTDEGIYGLGQHQNGYMNYRGRKVVLVQSNTDAVNPFLVSTQQYGILWDN
jgi:alpha-D-xyloside xylohydrolase